MLVSMKEILDNAMAEGYGVTAPNIFNDDTARACIEAAVEYRSPMIIDIHYQSAEKMMSLVKTTADLAREANVPVAINQDHGGTFEQAMWSIRAGCTSIMVDRSTKPFKENIAEVSELTRIAHAVGVSVEAELGHVGQADNYEVDGYKMFTDPEEAVKFVERTGIDCLAVAIGTAHGKYSGTPRIDFERLAEIKKVVKVPLVLHGGSGTGDENLARSTREGICKVNLATDLFAAGKEYLFNNKDCSVYSVFEVVKEGYKNKLIHYMKLFGQINKV
jgi:fructose-bisphosphate aldolase class II